VILQGFQSHQAALTPASPEVSLHYGKTLALVEQYLHTDAIQLAPMQCILLATCTERLNVLAPPSGAKQLQWIVPEKMAAGPSSDGSSSS
jgi:hypothetical protein